jgi:hypothetical protein
MLTRGGAHSKLCFCWIFSWNGRSMLYGKMLSYAICLNFILELVLILFDGNLMPIYDLIFCYTKSPSYYTG